MSGDLSALRQKLWRAYAALARTLRQLQRAERCSKAPSICCAANAATNCRCVSGDLHASWVLTRSEGARTGFTPSQRTEGQGPAMALEYRRYQRARRAGPGAPSCWPWWIKWRRTPGGLAGKEGSAA